MVSAAVSLTGGERQRKRTPARATLANSDSGWGESTRSATTEFAMPDSIAAPHMPSAEERLTRAAARPETQPATTHPTLANILKAIQDLDRSVAGLRSRMDHLEEREVNLPSSVLGPLGTDSTWQPQPGRSSGAQHTTRVSDGQPAWFAGLVADFGADHRSVVDRLLDEMPEHLARALPDYVQQALDDALDRARAGKGEKVRNVDAYRRGALVAVAQDWTNGREGRVRERMEEVLKVSLTSPATDRLDGPRHSCASYDCPICGAAMADYEGGI